MGCPFLAGQSLKFCSVIQGDVAMSIGELRLRCETSSYHICKLYQKFREKGVKLPLQEYVNYGEVLKG